ncbi:GNAT family N-acetyltransferase [Lihuaxuella thermophila]|uniref:L-amino acid N-acyltransferase YncA n=1 Tax=Lihuaxuella thermophila TaxID=1173111 RepID=A0A1H8AC25_9BACL|nr:GNAT family N-acetyltransferase [Lihuaxuella thermophila]SEM68103.1 L-amino acid N-acyltransferase YncA [Lihuaxuella thermophila]
MRIRKANPSDAEEIARVHIKSWQTTYRGIVDDEVLDNFDLGERVELWNRILTHRSIVYVAEHAEGNIVGFASGGKERSDDYPYDGELYAIYLLQEYQGQGIGKKLASAVLGELKQQGMTSALVWVLAENPARRFYEALGGKEIATQPLTIGKKTFQEVAYGWSNLNDF